MVFGFKAFNGKRSSITFKRGAFYGAMALFVALGAICVRPAVAAPAPERSLAGIKIFSSSDLVLKRFGSPDEVRTGTGSTSLLTPGNINMGSGGGGASQGGGPGGPGGFVPEGAGGPPPGAGDPYAQGAPGASSDGSASTPSTTTTWVYDRSDGSSLEFTISSNGRVIQIHLTGYKSQYKTARGIELGDSYGEVVSKYSYPEDQNVTGTVLNLNYVQKFHTAFQFMNQKLVGIVVAAVD